MKNNGVFLQWNAFTKLKIDELDRTDINLYECLIHYSSEKK